MRPTTHTKKWPMKRLSHLVDFLEQMHPEGMSLKNISRRTGLKEQYISDIFIKDNIGLKTMEKIVECYGFQLKLYFPEMKDMPYHPETIREYENAGNLTGLARYLSQRNISIHNLCINTNFTDGVLKRALETGNIRLSNLIEIVNFLKIDILWNFEPNNK